MNKIKKIVKRWNLILPGGGYQEIPNLVLNPMGVATNLGITEHGTFKSKDHIMHNLSFPGQFLGKLVSGRVKKHLLEP